MELPIQGLRGLMDAFSAERRSWLFTQVAQGRLAADELDPARAVLGLVPSVAGWRQILVGSLLASGLGLLAAALIFAVAFNWDALGHFSRFALVQGMVLLFAGTAWWRGVRTLAGEAALVAACLAVGALLALFGQTYQTGADPYSLFTTWALLILPWTLHAARASLWLLWVVVVNTGLALYCAQVLGESGWLRLFGLLEWSSTLALVLNGLLLVAAERFTFLGTTSLARAVPRVLAVLVVASVATILIPWVGWRGSRIDGAFAALGLAALAAAVLAGVLWWYLKRQRDLVILSAAALCAVGVGYAMIIRILPHGDASGWFLFSAFYWVGAISAAVLWLRDPGAPPGAAAAGPDAADRS